VNAYRLLHAFAVQSISPFEPVTKQSRDPAIANTSSVSIAAALAIIFLSRERSGWL
jgi:hypothetical protein